MKRQRKPFRLYERLGQIQGMPDLRAMGFESVSMPTEDQLLDAVGRPIEGACRAAARAAVAAGMSTLIADIERLPTDLRESRRDQQQDWTDAMMALMQVVAWIKDEAPALNVGLYDLLPGGHHQVMRAREMRWAAQTRAANGLRPTAEDLANDRIHKLHYARYLAACDVLSTVHGSCDLITASIYQSANVPNWAEATTVHLQQARRLAGKKPLLAWVHYRLENDGRLLSPREFGQQLAMARRWCDGLIVWGWQDEWDVVGPFVEMARN